MQSLFRPIAVVTLLLTSLAAFAEPPIWAKKAVGFTYTCSASVPKEARQCRTQRIPSPDHKKSVEIVYYKLDDAQFPKLVVTDADAKKREAGVPVLITGDLLWAPDSKAFFITGNDESAICCNQVYVYRLSDPELKPRKITAAAKRDMAATFPACRAVEVDQDECKELESDDYNMSAIDWVHDSSAVVVMAEVPCTGTYGGIMCQIMGYELEVPTGRILRRLKARDFKRKWQQSAAWRIQIPDPPEYKK